MISTETVPERVRRSYSKEFKRQVMAECREPGNSVAGVALKHGINANVVHKWRRRDKAQTLTVTTPEFVRLPGTSVTPMTPTPTAIRVEVQRNGTVVAIHWPTADAAACARWLSEWLR